MYRKDMQADLQRLRKLDSSRAASASGGYPPKVLGRTVRVCRLVRRGSPMARVWWEAASRVVSPVPWVLGGGKIIPLLGEPERRLQLTC
jgi:hypothetical protein